ncbi:MAG: V-type ATP synthase subunit E [Candidatus Freyarchaeota archaeon]|nr:V-type ATP synthase subunit E [Candidatus Jordarchaeia archaeon]MBS7267832.1 V-type ATP synthase subunit E [Candidatus Jordarchaeia archaeon]MBS7281041.1 V-type ATP synthase subunit E [Candidatus Jordarchaeia archaeon]
MKVAGEEVMEESVVEGEEEPESERLKKIKDKIEKDAEERASQIIEKAKIRAKEIEEEAISKAEKRAEEIIRRGMEEAERYKRRRLAEAKLKAKQRITKAREQLIEQTFQKANEKLKELTATPKYKSVLEALIQKAAIGVGGGELEILVPKGHEKHISDISSIAEKVQSETKNPTHITISKETIEAVGGCLVRRKDGSIYIDNTFESIMERNMKELRIKAARTIF